MKSSSTLIGFISAFALHIIIGSLLLLSADFSLPKEKPKVRIIEASVVSQKLFDDLAARKAEKILKEKRRQEQIYRQKERVKQEKIAAVKAAKEKAQRIASAKAAQIKAQKIAEVKAAKEKAQRIASAKAAQIKAQKIAAVKAAKEKAQKLAAEKAAKEKAQKLAAEKAAKEKAQKLAAEKAAKEKARKLAKAKAERLAKEKERLRQADLDKQMEAEFADEFSNAQNAKQLSEIARYKALIQDKISRNWQVNSDMKGLSCTLAIRLASDGLVLSVNRSTGDAKLCASAKRAAFKAKTLPIPKDPEIAPQFRDFDITLEPDL